MIGFLIALVWYLVASGTEPFVTTAIPIYNFLWWWYVITSIFMFFVPFYALDPKVTYTFLDKLPLKTDVTPGMCFAATFINYIITRILIYLGMVKISQALILPDNAISSPLTAGIILIVLGSLFAGGLTTLVAAKGEVQQQE